MTHLSEPSSLWRTEPPFGPSGDLDSAVKGLVEMMHGNHHANASSEEIPHNPGILAYAADRDEPCPSNSRHTFTKKTTTLFLNSKFQKNHLDFFSHS
jgi:hypothetical protein